MLSEKFSLHLKKLLTPAMNRPNATPSLETLWMPKSVGQGCQRLPGASIFENPSTKMTSSRRKVDMIPSIEAYESNERGRNTDGKRLKEYCRRAGNKEVVVLTL